MLKELRIASFGSEYIGCLRLKIKDLSYKYFFYNDINVSADPQLLGMKVDEALVIVHSRVT